MSVWEKAGEGRYRSELKYNHHLPEKGKNNHFLLFSHISSASVVLRNNMRLKSWCSCCILSTFFLKLCTIKQTYNVPVSFCRFLDQALCVQRCSCSCLYALVQLRCLFLCKSRSFKEHILKIIKCLDLCSSQVSTFSVQLCI